MPENLVCVAKITSPHGVRGAVKLKTFTEDPESIRDYSPLYSKDGKEKFEITILSSKEGMLIAKISGVNDRNEAASLRGRELYADKNLFPDLEEDEFYYDDLIGMQVVLENGEEFGSVVNLHNFGGGDLVEISLQGQSKTELFAFTREIFPKIDAENKTVTISLPQIEFISDNDNQL
jgi:16S rRNA processing protein RimM